MILKPFSRSMGVSYRDFLNQNYFLALNDHGLKKINLKGIIKISKENDPDYKEIAESDIIPRRFEEFQLNPVLISESVKSNVISIVKDRLEKVDKDGNVDISFTSLGSVFSIEMLDIVWIFELASDDVRNGLEVIKDSLHFCDKAGSYELLVESFKKYLKYLENPSDHSLLVEVKNGFEQCIIDYSGNPFAHFMLGLIFHRPTAIFDIKRSIEEFSEAKKYFIEIENNYLTALCNYILAWLYYIDLDTDKAIELSLEAVDFEFMGIPEIYYNLSKYYASKKDAENAIKYLDEAIKMFDFLYALKAEIDDDFNNVKPELTIYFSKLKDEEKQKILLKLNEMGINFTLKNETPQENQA